jgi:hypothetical protein
LYFFLVDADLGGPTTIPVNNANPPTSKNLAQNNSNNNNNNNTLRGTGNVANVNNNNSNNKQAGGVSNPFTTPLADFNLPKEQLQELTSMPPDQLQQFLMQFYPQLMKQYSLSELSIKKQKQLQVKFLLNEARANNPGNNELTIGLNNLRKSKLLLDQEHETIFFSLPFFNKLPILNLIYSTIDHRRDLEELYSKTSKVSSFHCFFSLDSTDSLCLVESQSNADRDSIGRISLRCLSQSSSATHGELEWQSSMLLVLLVVESEVTLPWTICFHFPGQ